MALCTLSRNSLDRFFGGGGAFVAPAWRWRRASSLRLLSAASAMPSDFMAPSAAVEPIGDARVAGRQIGDVVLDLADALAQRIDRLRIGRRRRAVLQIVNLLLQRRDLAPSLDAGRQQGPDHRAAEDRADESRRRPASRRS